MENMYDNPFLSTLTSTSNQNSVSPRPTFGLDESWLNKSYTPLALLGKSDETRKSANESQYTQNRNFNIRRNSNLTSSPLSRSNSNSGKSSTLEQVNMISDKLAETTMDTSYTNQRSSASSGNGSGRIPRVKASILVTDKPVQQQQQQILTYHPNNNENPSSSTMAKKFVNAAQTIMNRWNPNREFRSASGVSRTSLPQDGEGNKLTAVGTGTTRPDYGPRYGEEIAIDFQSYRTKLLKGMYFQSKLFNDIVVTEVQSPDCFYFRNNDTSHELEYMEESMKAWYDAYWTENANIDPKTIFKGCYYACYIVEKDWWYRCCVDGYIMEKDKSLEIIVQLMDYGTMAIVHQDCLLPLRKVYCKLPIQAAVATLQVIDDTIPWKKDEIVQFKTDVEGKHFQCFITEHMNKSDDEDFEYVKLVLLEIVNGEERPYSLESRMESRRAEKLNMF